MLNSLNAHFNFAFVPFILRWEEKTQLKKPAVLINHLELQLYTQPADALAHPLSAMSDIHTPLEMECFHSGKRDPSIAVSQHKGEYWRHIPLGPVRDMSTETNRTPRKNLTRLTSPPTPSIILFPPSGFYPRPSLCIHTSLWLDPDSCHTFLFKFASSFCCGKRKFNYDEIITRPMILLRHRCGS